MKCSSGERRKMESSSVVVFFVSNFADCTYHKNVCNKCWTIYKQTHTVNARPCQVQCVYKGQSLSCCLSVQCALRCSFSIVFNALLHSTSTWIDIKSETHAWQNVFLSPELSRSVWESMSKFANVATIIISNACSSQCSMCIICRLQYPVVYECCFWCEFNLRTLLSLAVTFCSSHVHPKRTSNCMLQM